MSTAFLLSFTPITVTVDAIIPIMVPEVVPMVIYVA